MLNFFRYCTAKEFMNGEKLNTGQKALQINLDAKKYGTFAEIGAGQEVARWFFHVGKASGTVAKTISAYDMAISDAIYGASDRYVSRKRLQSMLDHEFDLLLKRLDKTRGDKCTFFVFADTVATKRDEGQGWLGIKFQVHPHGDASQIMIHVRTLDKEGSRQQEALGMVGVNLVHGAFYLHEDPVKLIGALMDGLTSERIEVDMIKCSGPALTIACSRYNSSSNGSRKPPCSPPTARRSSPANCSGKNPCCSNAAVSVRLRTRCSTCSTARRKNSFWTNRCKTIRPSSCSK
jgi:hypothetical protein